MYWLEKYYISPFHWLLLASLNLSVIETTRNCFRVFCNLQFSDVFPPLQNSTLSLDFNNFKLVAEVQQVSRQDEVVDTNFVPSDLSLSPRIISEPVEFTVSTIILVFCILLFSLFFISFFQFPTCLFILFLFSSSPSLSSSPPPYPLPLLLPTTPFMLCLLIS